MIFKKKILFIIIIISLLICNLFFYLNSRSFISTYIINPLEEEIYIDSIKNPTFKKDLENYKKILKSTQSELNISKRFTTIFYSELIRFLQNNKTYKYLYSKENNFSKKEEKFFFSIVNNVNLEGAYFLNPEYLSTVKLQLFHNRKSDEKKLFEYIKFIINSELQKKSKNNSSVIFYADEIVKTDSFFKRNNKQLLEFINYSNFFFNNFDKDSIIKFENSEQNEKYLSFRTPLKIEKIKKDLLFLDEIAIKITNFQKIEKNEIELTRLKFKYILKHFQTVYEFPRNFFSEQSIYSLLNSDYFDKLFLISNNDWFINNTKEIKFNEDNFDFYKIEKKILDNIIYISKSFNIIELISINVFALVFAISIYFIILNFKKNTEK